MPFFGCFRPSLSSRRLNRSRSSARSMRSGDVPRIGMPACFSASGQLQRRLAAELHDHAVQRAVFLLLGEDFEHVLGGQRLEIEPVRGVVVGRDRLRIAVDHDGLVAGVAQREAGMAAAIVELDALADAVRAAAEDHDLLAVATAAPRRRARRRRASRRSNTYRRWARRTRPRRCRCACRPGARRASAWQRRTSASCVPASDGEPRVGEAHGLELRKVPASSGRPSAWTFSSRSTISPICSRNQRSILQAS